MCGIAGLYEVKQGRADLGRARSMVSLLRHRGPDDEGMVLLPRGRGEPVVLGGPDTPEDVFRSPQPGSPGHAHRVPEGVEYALALGHRRLSIVDLTPGGHQPMLDPATGNWLVYNGEIYNHVELRRELESAGHSFRTQSDTEVILAAYRAWGREALHRMNGMWAFALWDAARGELFCARDRLGVKPFYYQWDGCRFAFASEPKALVLTQERRPRASEPQIHALLALDWVDHSADTFFEDTRQLLPGQWLAVGPQGLRLESWWRLDPGRRALGTPEEWTERFAELFTDAVKLRLRADVEVGSCLSGGLDSSAVVSVAAANHPRALHTFTCAYDEGVAYDERPYVRAVVEATGATSHVVVPDGRDLFAVLETLTYQQDEPAAGPGLYSQWKVMELAHRAGLKVLLDGQGGDETLAGYHRYWIPWLRDLLVEGRTGDFLAGLALVSQRIGLKTTLGGLIEPLAPGLHVLLKRNFGAGKDRVLDPAFRRRHRGPSTLAPAAERSALWRQQAFDVERRFLPSLLRYEDRNSMAFAIETRLPFLDWRLVEFVFSLPDDQKLRGPVTKAILRRALGDRLPTAVRTRSDKMGFETPIDVWLRARHAREVRERLTREGPLQDYVAAGPLGEELESYLAGRRDIGIQVWRWLNLEAWLRRFVSRDPRIGARAPMPARAGAHLSYVEVMAGSA